MQINNLRYSGCRHTAQNLTQLLELGSPRVVQADSFHSMTSDVTPSKCVICRRPLGHVGADFAGKQIYQCVECDYAMTPAATREMAQELYDDPEYFDGWGSNLEFD